MAANSYDADASTILVILDSSKDILYLIDDGNGFLEKEIDYIGLIGGGSKRESDTSPGYSKSKRPYLGSYGFGLKSTLNIASKFDVRTTSDEGTFEVTVDWNRLDDMLQNNLGFDVNRLPNKKNSGTGTFFKLYLKSPMDKTDLNNFGKVLANLPIDNGKFLPFFGHSVDLGDFSIENLKFSDLKKQSKKLLKQNHIKRPGANDEIDLEKTQQTERRDDNQEATIKYYFGGIKDGRVQHIKKGLRGIYVRVHGRLLKNTFTERKYTYNISHYTQFESGLRVEIEANWLRDEITLSRDGLIFNNSKLENDFKKLIQKNIGAFINPRLKAIEKRKKQAIDRQLKQRRELCDKRLMRSSDVTIKGLNQAGFAFKPESDAELALIVSQKQVMEKINKYYKLIDYNDQTSFDCMVHDESKNVFIYTELEPHLKSFLSHNNREGIELIIVCDKSNWRIGAKKKGKGGYFQLVNAEHEKKNGHYRLHEFPGPKSVKPRYTYDVIVVEEVID